MIRNIIYSIIWDVNEQQKFISENDSKKQESGGNKEFTDFIEKNPVYTKKSETFLQK